MSNPFKNIKFYDPSFLEEVDDKSQKESPKFMNKKKPKKLSITKTKLKMKD